MYKIYLTLFLALILSFKLFADVRPVKNNWNNMINWQSETCIDIDETYTLTITTCVTVAVPTEELSNYPTIYLKYLFGEEDNILGGITAINNVEPVYDDGNDSGQAPLYYQHCITFESFSISSYCPDEYDDVWDLNYPYCTELLQLTETSFVPYPAAEYTGINQSGGNQLFSYAVFGMYEPDTDDCGETFFCCPGYIGPKSKPKVKGNSGLQQINSKTLTSIESKFSSFQSIPNPSNQDLGLNFDSIDSKSDVQNKENFDVQISNKLEFSSFQVTPNPFHQDLTLNFENASDLGKISIRNISGQELYYAKIQPDDNIIQISTHSWPSGIYMVTFIQNGQIIIKKIVK